MRRIEVRNTLRTELNTARTEYIEARTAFLEVLDEMRQVDPAVAGLLLKLAVEEHNRAFEIHRQAAHRYAAFCGRVSAVRKQNEPTQQGSSSPLV
jgi:hypothetical protein